jgi:hypothetical protein
MISFSKRKVIQILFFIYIFHICAKFQTKKKKRLIVTCVFECFQSHCHILKELHEFLYMTNAISNFGENSFIFNFVGYGLVIKSLGPECTFEEVA